MVKKRGYEDIHIHLPTKLEFFLALLIVVALSISLISQVSQKLFDIPRQAIVILIVLFLILKIHHIWWTGKKGAILEDYAAIGTIVLFLVLFLILKQKINPAIVTIFIFILIYSTGLMLWIKKTFESRKIVHFLISYITTVVIVILLFAGVYTGSGKFIEVGNPKKLTFSEALYVSIITFTTVGYGDIAPLGINRLFASIEALLGLVINIALIGYILASERYN